MSTVRKKGRPQIKSVTIEFKGLEKQRAKPEVTRRK